MGTPARVLEPTAVRRLLSHGQRWKDATCARVIVLLSFHAGLRACRLVVADGARPGGGMSERLSVAGTIAKNGRARCIRRRAHCGRR